MSNTKQGFADDVRRFLAMFSSIAAYANEVEKVGSLEQAATEAEVRIEKAKKFFEMQRDDLDRQHAAHLATVQHAEQEASKASTEVSNILAAAHVEADKILTRAQADANAIVANGHKLAQPYVETVEQLKQEATNWSRERDQARQTLAKIHEEIDAAVNRRKEVRASLDELKARI